MGDSTKGKAGEGLNIEDALVRVFGYGLTETVDDLSVLRKWHSINHWLQCWYQVTSD